MIPFLTCSYGNEVPIRYGAVKVATLLLPLQPTESQYRSLTLVNSFRGFVMDYLNTTDKLITRRMGFWIFWISLFLLSYPLLKSFILFTPGG
jgi:hypothetical protein